MSDTEHIYGGNELAKLLSGRTIGKVDTTGGWILLELDDGSTLHISAEYGYSLQLEYEKGEEWLRRMRERASR